MAANPTKLRSGADAPPARAPGAGRAGLAGGLVLAAVVLALLVPFLGADPPRELTYSNARTTDEGFNLNNARQWALFGEFATGDVDRSLTNGVYSAIAALVFRLTEPTLAIGRSVSAVAVALAVLLLAVGLAEPLGRRAALLSAAALAGANLALEYGRLGMVEPTVVAFLTGGFVLAVRALRRGSAPAGAGAGLLLAGAVSAKAIAVVPMAAMLLVMVGSGLWRRDRRALLAGLWGVGLWLALAVGSYHPNRYIVPALPGMAVLAGFGLATLTALLPRDRGRAALAVGLGLLLAAPGVAKYLGEAASSGHQREQDQRILAAALPAHAVVFGHYAPTLLFDTRHELVTLWPAAGANAGDPVARFGATHVLASGVGDHSDPTLEIPSLRRLRYQVSVPRVDWASHTLELYRLQPQPPPARGG
jgi:4-amino-4-deoxy-L-arabinose transferase-like glycosyltransferase